MKTFTDYMREADALELPNLRFELVEPDTTKWGGEKPPCCAIGGAIVAAGRGRLDDDGFYGLDGWPVPRWLEAQMGRCPDTDCAIARAVPNIVAHLFDTHRWSRTRIADWVDATFGRDHDESDWLPQ